MTIRHAVAADIPGVTAIYGKILSREEAGLSTTGWQSGVYPTEQTARVALNCGELFVMEEQGALVAAARINHVQVPEYALCPWEHAAPDKEIMVIHTLVVDPECGGRGLATAFVAFYEEYARSHGCLYLRMDTNARNIAARSLYKKLGYREPGIVSCNFNGLPGVQLVCLEKKLEV